MYGQVYDGRLPTTSEAPTWLETSDVEHKVFRQRTDFIAWLAAQTDDSLSGKDLPEPWQRNAGRLTIERLGLFAENREGWQGASRRRRRTSTPA